MNIHVLLVLYRYTIVCGDYRERFELARVHWGVSKVNRDSRAGIGFLNQIDMGQIVPAAFTLISMPSVQES